MKTASRKKPHPAYAPLPRDSVLLALDVSSSAMGWAVGETTGDGGVSVLGFDVDRPPSGWDFQRRVMRMMTTVNWIIGEFGVTWVAMEFQSHKTTGKRVQGLAVLGQAQGAVWNHILATRTVDRISERDWVRLNGRNAKKETRCEYVKAVVPAYAARLEENPKFDVGMDAADALGILIWRAKQGYEKSENGA
jgi:Holliday junction resolvasome RuvABC endonuclease subunit